MAQLAVLARGAVPTGQAVAYRTPTEPGMLKEVLWTNRTGSPLSVSLWLVPAGQVLAASHELYCTFSLPAYSVTRDVYTTLLEPGDSIVWQASGSGINGYITGLQDMPTGHFGEVTTI